MFFLIFFIGLLLLLFAIGLPVAISIGFTSLSVMAAQSGIRDIPYGLTAINMMYGVNNFPILAVPFFVLAANIMNAGGVTSRIFGFANCLVGHVRGGLGHVNVLASMIFAGMSGTAVADAAGLGTLEIRAMRDAGYDLGFSTGITGASSVIGPIIPPSVAMIIYGWLADVSVGGLFIGAIVPGVMMGVFMMVMVYIYAVKRKTPQRPRASLGEILTSSRDAILSLLTPVIIVGGIWSGVFTPTESGAVASLYAIILVSVIYRDVSPRKLLEVFYTTIEFTAIILFIISCAMLYAWLMVRLRIPLILAEGLVGISSNPLVVLFIITGFLLIVGCFMSVLESVIVFTPILTPMVTQLGIDPLFFGIFMVITLSIGVLTPPFGNVIYVLVRITGLPFEQVVKSILPFILPIFAVIVLIILFPSLTTYIPGIWMR
jgi:tripartite ATP-independent transporter DctM subunit